MGLVLVGGFLFPIYNLFSNYSEFVIKYSSQLFIILELSNILISIRPSECSLTIRDAILELTYICIPFNINQNSNTIWNSVLNFTFIYWVSFIISNHSRRKIEKRMSICLTWFPINDFRLNQYLPESGWFYKNVGFLWRSLEEGSQFFHEIRLQFLLYLTPFQILILLVCLDVLFHHQL